MNKLTLVQLFYFDQAVCSLEGSILTYRWPTILTGVINTIVNINHELHSESSSESEKKLQEGKEIISKISVMKHEMARNVHLP